jgi:hypothetical protein
VVSPIISPRFLFADPIILTQLKEIQQKDDKADGSKNTHCD